MPFSSIFTEAKGTSRVPINFIYLLALLVHWLLHKTSSVVEFPLYCAVVGLKSAALEKPIKQIHLSSEMFLKLLGETTNHPPTLLRRQIIYPWWVPNGLYPVEEQEEEGAGKRQNTQVTGA